MAQEVILIIICLLLNALFAAYEMAFISSPKPELRSLAKKGSKVAQKLLILKEHPERTLSVIQIGITLVGAVAAAVGGAEGSEALEPYFTQQWGVKESTAEALAVFSVVIPISYLSVVIGELVPKTLALRNPTKLALWGAQPLFVVEKVFSPVVTILEVSTKVILKILFPRGKTPVIAEQMAIEIHSFSPTHQKFLLNMANIERKKIQDVLLPWSEATVIHVDNDVQDITRAVFSSGHTRLPVIRGNDILGILHTKEFMALKEAGEVDWQKIVRPALKAHPQHSLLGVLRLMQEKRTHMVIVMSDTAEWLGLVTMEDIWEEIIGDISDEDDDGRVRRVFASRARNRNLRPSNN